MAMLVPRLEKLRRALKDGKRISMTYQSGRNPEGETRTVDVYGLFHRLGWWYVVGFCQLRKGMRTFRVDRILDLALTEETYTRPADFDFHAYIAQDWQDVPQVRVRMRFAPQCAHLALYAKGYWESMEERPDGSTLVTFNAPDLYAAASNALTYGPGVMVLEPLEVRNMVREWAQVTADMYRENPDTKEDGEIK